MSNIDEHEVVTNHGSDDGQEELDASQVQSDIRTLMTSVAEGSPDDEDTHEVLHSIHSLIAKYSSARQELSSWKDLKGASAQAYRNVVSTYTQAICIEVESPEKLSQILLDLCLRLSRLLNLADSVELMDRCLKDLRTSLSPDARKEISQLLHDNLTTGKTKVTVTTRATIGAAMDDVAKSDTNWCTGFLLDDSLKNFPSNLHLAHSLLETLSCDEWANTVAPALLLKLRSHPDKAFPTALGWIQNVSHALTDLSDDWLATVLDKHILAAGAQSAATRKELAIQLLLAWTSKSPVAWSSLCLATASRTTTLAPARQACFILYKALAQQASPSVEHTDEIGGVIPAILTFLSKETNAKQRSVGNEALVGWLILANKTNEKVGYEKGLEFVRKTLSSLATSKTTEQSLLSLLVQTASKDCLKSMVGDLWRDGDKWQNSLEAIITAAGTKKAVHMDGVAVIYLWLLYTSQIPDRPVPPVVQKILSSGSADNKKDPSFLYSKSMNDSIVSNEFFGLLLPRTFALYTELNKARSKDSLDLFPRNRLSAAAETLASCILHPSTVNGKYSPESEAEHSAGNSLAESLEVILKCEPHSAPAITESLLEAVNLAPGDKHAENTREGEDVSNVLDFDASAVRRAARLLGQHIKTDSGRLLATVMTLMHVGSTLQSEGHQRAALILNTLDFLRTHVQFGETEFHKEISTEIIRIGTQSHMEDAAESKEISEVVHRAGLSLLLSLGGVAANYSPDMDDPNDKEMVPYVCTRQLCLDSLAPGLSSRLNVVQQMIENLSTDDIELFESPMGSLFCGKRNGKPVEPKKVSGKRLSEDELWEQQLKQELANKKKKPVTMSAEDKKAIASQDVERTRVAFLIHNDFRRVLEAVQHLVVSDIEFGNSCLPSLGGAVLRAAVSSCAAADLLEQVRNLPASTLQALAECVYEIDDIYAPTIAEALMLSSKVAGEVADGTLSQELPSPCPSAENVIRESEAIHDTLSGPSFCFLFPIFRACLTGPRTPNGCGNFLKVFERHTELLHGEKKSTFVMNMRRDMIVGVLELLKHDRAQAFQEPSAFDSLTSCLKVDDALETPFPFTTSELAPLLDDRGALGSRNCRLGAMICLEVISTEFPKAVKSNPLMESRLWLNCFEEDTDIRSRARCAWNAAHEVEGDVLSRPSPLCAASLLPLLSHEDQSISQAAADAFAKALALHPALIKRNVEMLCTKYIDSFPTPSQSQETGLKSGSLPLSLKPAAAPPAKKKVTQASLLPKKAASKKSALSIAGIGRPTGKTTKKKSSMHSAMLKPKAERVLNEEELANQFKTKSVKKEDIPEERDSPEKVAVRVGVLSAVSALSKLGPEELSMDEATVKLLTSFLMAYGIADEEEKSKNRARNVLREIVASFGGSNEAIAFLLPHLESVLKTGIASEDALEPLARGKIPSDIAASDRRKEGAVVALGSVALHLKGAEYEGKIDDTVDMLIGALKTPSENVQLSVADALSKLMKKGRTTERTESLLKGFLADCLHGDSLAVRRGAAYGISAGVKGSGIASLKKYDIVKQLEEACSAGTSSEKEGALFAIELLSSRLGLLFEPYVIVLLPSLLQCFSDGSDHVREAASNTVSVIMSKLSAHGVKLVLPAVLEAFDDAQWRTKQASIHMLGSMSHLAPKQLASALPKVVPKLTEAFSDTHPKVKASAQAALDEISNVVRNPEIASISGTLMKALTDPADYTIRALEVLIETEFLHAIDAPSLALIVPILHRGLRDRGATTKRYAALISANITTMVNDPKEMLPYLPTVLPDIQSTLLDPIPDVRSTAAKALGSLTRSLGDQILPELRPWLVNKLRDASCSSAERSGAAQGLTEVILVSGSELVDETMRTEILPLHTHPEPSTREGVLWVLSFLPPALGQSFTPLIDVSLPALITGLSDESEPVREVALRAGRVLIRSHGKHHSDKILPSLESGLGDEDHRIRIASLSLLGDLLSTIGGTSVVKGEGDTQDDVRRAERAQAQIALTLGPETRRRVFSNLYLARSDSVHQVRQSALQIWKTVVSITGRTLREILPVLVSRVIDDLASGNEEKTAVAGRCLGDVVSKLGDSVLPQIIPVLRNALADGDEHTKRGVCVGLTEVIGCSNKDQILRFLDIIVKVVQDALSDESSGVRAMAAASFQSLYSIVGSRAFDEVVPSLLVGLESEDVLSRSRALNGLTGILSVRSRELLPYIVPRLIKRPFSANNAHSLKAIVEVTETTIHTQFSSIIPAVMGALSEDEMEDVTDDAVRELSKAICRHVQGAGVNTLVSMIASTCGSDKAAMRRESCRMFENVIVERSEQADFYEEIPIIIRETLYRLNDEDEAVLKANYAAFNALSTHVPAEELVKHVEFTRNLLASMVSDARRRKGGVGDGVFLLPGFNMPKGLQPLIPMYQRGILYGTPTIREVSAAGLGEAICLTDAKYLAGPIVVKMTGPLLRIVGGRNPANVKVAILKTLGLILVKGGAALKAFVAQFQTTFVKALSDPSRQVRVEAIEALSLLMPLSTRVDPLIKELVAGSVGKTAPTEDLAATAVQTATLEALAVVLEKGGSKAKLPTSIPAALDAAKDLITNEDEGIREGAGKVLGAACTLLGAETTAEVLSETIIPLTQSDAGGDKHGGACATYRVAASDAGTSVDQETLASLQGIMMAALNGENDSVRQASVVALLAVAGRLQPTNLKTVEPQILKVMNNAKESMDLHRSVAQGLCVCLLMIDPANRLDFLGVTLTDASLKLALSGAQRVQFAFNDVLWLALDVAQGQDALDRYAGMAVFDNVRSMRSLHSKVLSKMKGLSSLE